MTIDFAPLVPLALILALAIAAALLSSIGFWRGIRGTVLRTLAAALLLLALANPSLLLENREQLSTIVAVVVDHSASQMTPERQKQTTDALAQLKDRLSRLSGIETRIIDVTDDPESESPSTRLFSALASNLEDVPPSRIGGAFFITDGQIHDVPSKDAPLGFSAPLNGLITGHAQEFDRRIDVVKAPRFGIVGQQQTLVYRLIEDGKSDGAPADVTIRMNGQIIDRSPAIPGKDTSFSFDVPRGGNNVIEFEAAEKPGEITTANNHATHVIDGIRQNLRVLLVSGEPHAGERAWRNLLKSDASVDLVHFTILRPPEKQDGTPINELSLIAFPTRELFVEKIKDFDLIIFDRYQHRDVLPILYYDYISEYVKDGGALLIAAGPEHAGEDSIAYTPLASVLPASPTGEVTSKPFYPRLTDIGKKHPVTRGLEGSDSEPPHWARWFRSIDVDMLGGQAVMQASDNKPLLVLNRVGEGRVAMLLSDQGWLWARGFEGGGPHVSLYRRIAHWLMKEPALEEEALTARSLGRAVEITRQTIGDAPGKATVIMPSGQQQDVDLTEAEPGLYRATLKTTETGLFSISNGDLSALVHVGAVDAPEFKAAISTTQTLQPSADKTFGRVTRLAENTTDAITIPQILPVSGTIREADPARMLVEMTGDTVLKGVNAWSLLSGLLGLAALLMVIAGTWWREGR